ncbi:MAG: ribbon-helix-helix domain-containing protein [Faecousia sp.]
MPKFVARKPEKEVISMRIDSDVLKTIDNKAAAVGISRNELMNQMILYALSNMDEPAQGEAER